MSNISCGYRIYPTWFGSDSMAGPMRELADGSARRMGKRVINIEITGHGENRRGMYIDFRVTYGDVMLEMRR